MNKNDIQKAVLETASYVCEKYPQTEGKKINYSLGGSVSVVLLSMADSCRICDVSMLGTVQRGEYIEISDEVKGILQKYARTVKDIDIEKRFNKNYVRNMKDIDIHSMPIQAREGLVDKNKDVHICNKLGEFFKPELWRITIEDKRFCIQSLENMYKNKFMYIPANYVSKHDNFNKDMDLLGQAVNNHYGPQKMDQINDDMAKEFKKLDNDNHFMKTFVVNGSRESVRKITDGGSFFWRDKDSKIDNNYLRIRLNEVLRNPELSPNLQKSLIDVVEKAGLRKPFKVNRLGTVKDTEVIVKNVAFRQIEKTGSFEQDIRIS